jgi:hypothetical protein
VIAVHVLEHIVDDRKAISELFRVLHPGGWALICVPLFGELTYEDPLIVSPRDREIAFLQWDHVRKYGTDVSDRLRDAGFAVTELRADERFDVTRYGLFGFEIVHLCRRPNASTRVGL